MGTLNEKLNRSRATTGLAGALFTTTQQRVLSLLFGQPRRSFFTREVIGLIGAGTGGVQRELKRLVGAGLVVQTSVGNQKHYQANSGSPIFAELCSIVRKTLGVRAELVSAFRPLVDDVIEAFIFGSVAREEDTAQSDVDVLIVSDSLGLEDVYSAMASAEQRLGRRVSPTLYSDAEFQRRKREKNSFVAKILAGPVVVIVDRRHG